MEAASFVHVLEQRQQTRIACPEEIAYRMGLISKETLLARANALSKSEYGTYLRQVAETSLT